MNILQVIALLLLIFLNKTQAVSSVAKYNCVRYQDYSLIMMFRLDKKDENIVKIRALNQITDQVIDECFVSGTGTETDLFQIDVLVTANGLANNNCGMTIKTSGDYQWKFRVYDSDDTMRSPLDVNYFVTCPKTGTTVGWVSLSVDVSPDRPLAVQFTQNDQPTSKLKVGDVFNYKVSINPSGTGASQFIQSARGIFVYNCEVSSDSQFQRNVYPIIDENGCRVSASSYAPASDFKQSSSSSVFPIVLEAKGARVETLGDSNNVYLRCDYGICTTDNDQFCLQRCLATVSTSAQTANEKLVPSSPLVITIEITSTTLSTTTTTRTSGGAGAESARSDVVIIAVMSSLGALLLIGAIIAIAVCLYAANRKKKNKYKKKSFNRQRKLWFL
ncbi:hypothetical protein CHS0354_015381 [Potamilus streckersoni]|uniref:ZP domain-containing protein n=1 Tax=Potamilus streckersoni TaxID=2493646 RepID=A0AAE0VML7_9BIVA|nr:hypothetical protein CHS0354_015381 [Potamilus streckersoni]